MNTSEYEKDLISILRQEAKSVKDCFTNFSFQVIAFASAILGIIANFQQDNPEIALASIAPILFLITVARIGTYKYASANRMFGYELHLYRSKHIEDGLGEGWKAYMRQIGWEEAMRAWRVVQATVFAEIYNATRLNNDSLRPKYREPERGKYWFSPEDLVVRGTKYYSGSYLRVMNSTLYLLAGLCLIPLYFMSIQLSIWWIWIIPVLTTIYLLYRWHNDCKRRAILEKGLLSIHSCAVIWQAVVVAHYRALKNLQAENYNGYTEALSKQAKELAENVRYIHTWVME